MVVLLDLPVLVRLCYNSGGCIDRKPSNESWNHPAGESVSVPNLYKGTATYDHSTVPILNSAGDDLAGRSRGLVHQHDQTSLLELSASGRVRLLTRLLTPFRINDQPVFIQELIRQLCGDIQISPPFPANPESSSSYPCFRSFSNASLNSSAEEAAKRFNLI